jgi:hypothetical protein
VSNGIGPKDWSLDPLDRTTVHGRVLPATSLARAAAVQRIAGIQCPVLGAHSLYVIWDAVAWHDSASLLSAVDCFSKVTLHSSAGPVLELVPLPTSARFLNVVEGVLSGVTRAVMDNPDYPSSIEINRAISRNLVERNEHFQNNPKRAGKKISELNFFHDVETFRAGDYRQW